VLAGATWFCQSCNGVDEGERHGEHFRYVCSGEAWLRLGRARALIIRTAVLSTDAVIMNTVSSQNSQAGQP